MAITFDAATDGGNNGGSTSSLTFAHTMGTGAGRALVVGFEGSASSGGTGLDDISGVTYAGVAMTLAAKNTSASIGSYIYVYYLLGPATGANNVVISAGSTHQIYAGAMSYLGVHLDGQPHATTTNQAASSSLQTLTTSLTPTVAGCWTMLLESTFDGAPPPVAGAGATRRVYEGAFETWGLFDSNGAATAGASYSMTTTRDLTPTDPIAHVMIALRPATPTITPRLIRQAVKRAATY